MANLFLNENSVYYHSPLQKILIWSLDCFHQEFFNREFQGRDSYRFLPDTRTTHQSGPFDFIHTNFDRGHGSPYAIFRARKRRSLSTFLYTNVIPMNLHLNRGPWNNLVEEHGLNLARDVHYETRFNRHNGRVFSLTGCCNRRYLV